MKGSEAKRILERFGCVFTEGTKHWVITYKGKQSVMPRHPGREIANGTFYKVLKDLGIRWK